MKVVLAGAFGNLGAEILKCLCAAGHEVVAADLKERPVEGCEGKYTFKAINATKPETLEGLCDGAEVVITTMGLTGASTTVTSLNIFVQEYQCPRKSSSIGNICPGYINLIPSQ